MSNGKSRLDAAFVERQRQYLIRLRERLGIPEAICTRGEEQAAERAHQRSS